jgi:hypothetical protein
MKAVGNFAIIKLENSVSQLGIQIKTDGKGVVHSCPSIPDIEGKTVLFDDRHRYITHEEFIFVPTENILGVFK